MAQVVHAILVTEEVGGGRFTPGSNQSGRRQVLKTLRVIVGRIKWVSGTGFGNFSGSRPRPSTHISPGVSAARYRWFVDRLGC